MEKRFMLIANPVSGKGTAKNVLSPILIEFAKYSYTATVFMTRARYDATRFAEEYAGEFDLVVCIGGDGTFSEVVNGLMKLEQRPKLGYIPMGTTNDVASCLKLPKDIKDAVKLIVDGGTIPYDVGTFVDRYFSYVAAFGAFTEVSYATPQDIKSALGHVAYLLEGMRYLPKLTFEHAVVTYDDGTLEGDFIFGAVTNATRVAGIVKLDPAKVLLHDGYFEVLLIRNPQNIVDLNTIITNVFTQKYDDENVVLLHTKNVSFAFDREVAWTYDGENGGKYRELELRNLKHALNIIA